MFGNRRKGIKKPEANCHIVIQPRKIEHDPLKWIEEEKGEGKVAVVFFSGSVFLLLPMDEMVVVMMMMM